MENIIENQNEKKRMKISSVVIIGILIFLLSSVITGAGVYVWRESVNEGINEETPEETQNTLYEDKIIQENDNDPENDSNTGNLEVEDHFRDKTNIYYKNVSIGACFTMNIPSNWTYEYGNMECYIELSGDLDGSTYFMQMSYPVMTDSIPSSLDNWIAMENPMLDPDLSNRKYLTTSSGASAVIFHDDVSQSYWGETSHEPQIVPTYFALIWNDDGKSYRYAELYPSTGNGDLETMKDVMIEIISSVE